MNYIIRQEEQEDYIVTERVVEAAFKNEELSDHDEHNLVARIRKSAAFIPELSLLAVDSETNDVIGHILLSKIHIGQGEKPGAISLALAPVSVLPNYQQQGIGKALIETALNKARDLGFHSVVLLGHPSYYPKFGFKRASLWGIKAPFEVPDEAFMALELTDGALADVSGVVKYSEAFM